jgi:hypothetical protein
VFAGQIAESLPQSAAKARPHGNKIPDIHPSARREDPLQGVYSPSIPAKEIF